MIIVLDLDGVTHPKYMPKGTSPFPSLGEQLDHAFQADKLKVIEDVLDDLPDADILISSTWRTDENHKTAMMEALTDKIKECTVGATYIIPHTVNHIPNGHVEAEIQLWLADNAPDERWLAINDQGNMFYPDAPLFLIDGDVGLQEGHKNDIIAVAREIEENTSTEDIHARREYVLDQHQPHIHGHGAVIDKPQI